MRLKLVLLLLLIPTLIVSCAPEGGQPFFSWKLLPEATSIPMPSAQPHADIQLSDAIESFDVSPDRSMIALATSGGLRLYDLHTDRYLRSLNDGEETSAVAWSPDGARLAVGGSKDYGTPFFVGGDSTNSSKARLTIWDTSTWKIVFEPAYGNEMVNDSIRTLAWSPDGRSLAFSAWLGGVQVLDTQTRQITSRQTNFSSTVMSLAWSPDSSRLVATNDMAYGIRRWKVSDDEAVRLFDPRAGQSNTIAWSPDGARIASGHMQGGVCFWTASTNRCDGFFRAHQTATFSLAWSPDGNELATGGGVIRIWDTHTGKLIRGFGQESRYLVDRLEWPVLKGPIISLEYSIEDPLDTVVRLWDPRSGSILAEFRGAPRGGN